MNTSSKGGGVTHSCYTIHACWWCQSAVSPSLSSPFLRCRVGTQHSWQHNASVTHTRAHTRVVSVVPTMILSASQRRNSTSSPPLPGPAKEIRWKLQAPPQGNNRHNPGTGRMERRLLLGPFSGDLRHHFASRVPFLKHYYSSGLKRFSNPASYSKFL